MVNNPVVVGIDGSDDSKAALKWAIEYGQQFEVPVVAMAVWNTRTPAFGYWPRDAETPEKIEERTREMLDDTIIEAVGADTEVIQQVERGHPAETLVVASGTARLLVLGTRGHGAFAGILLGSVSQHCVAHAKCPFVVLRHGKGDNKKRK